MRLKDSLGKAKRFIKSNKVTMFQLAAMVAVIGLDTSGAFAGTISTSTQGFDKITKPLENFSAVMSGPIPKFIGMAGISAAGLATALSMENQVMKRGIQLMGGTGAAIGASSLISVGASGCLFL